MSRKPNIPAPISTAPRSTPIPKAEGPKVISHEMIAKRAYEIFISGKGGSAVENWIKAERELRSR